MTIMEDENLFLQHQAQGAPINEISPKRLDLYQQIHQFELKEIEFLKRIDESSFRIQQLENQVQVFGERVEQLEFETKQNNGFLFKALDSLRSAKDCLIKIIECLDDEKVIDRVDIDQTTGIDLELDTESREVLQDFLSIARLASEAVSKVNDFKDVKKKEKRELENSVVSLTEENRDINSLLRVALVEKEAVEKSLNKLKGNTEQKRVALLQIAERGLQRVGFGFMMGSGSSEQSVESSGASNTTTIASTTASTKSDSSECEEEVVSLVCLISLSTPNFGDYKLV